MVSAHGVYQWAQHRQAVGTFADPNSYADYLVLMLPGLVGMVIVGVHGTGMGTSTTRA